VLKDSVMTPHRLQKKGSEALSLDSNKLWVPNRNRHISVSLTKSEYGADILYNSKVYNDFPFSEWP